MGFVIGIMIGTFLAAVLEFAMEWFYKRTWKYKESLGGAQNFRESVPEQLEIVNIGSGPGLYAITYEHSGKRGFNFSTAPQNYKYGFRLLKRFSDNLCANCIIIIIIMCPLSFGNNDEYLKPEYSDKFYGILPPEDIDGYSVKRAWLLHHPLLKKVFQKIGAKKNSAIHGDKIEMEVCQEPDIIRTWKQEFQLENLIDVSQAGRHKIAFAEKRQVLCEGIDYCYARGWRPVFVIPPVPAETRAYVGEAFLQAFVYDNLEKVKSRYPGISLLDYYGDARFGKSMFRNGIFVNEAGKQRFSDILFHDIAECFSEG